MNLQLDELSKAFNLFPTAAEVEPALIELGQAVEEAWSAIMPWAVLHCDDGRLGLILGKRKSLAQRLLEELSWENLT